MQLQISKALSGKRVLITGNTGFKGSWLSIWLLEMGARVFGVAQSIPTEPSLFKATGLEKFVKCHWIDVTDYAALRECVLKIKPDFIFHTAAQPLTTIGYQKTIETFHTNILGTANILESARNLKNFCVIILVTSDKCYANKEWVWGYRENDALGGKDPYSASKGAAEIVIRSYYESFFKKSDNIRLASARAGNVIGGGDWAKYRLIPDCIKAWNNKKAVEIRSPAATRPWQHVLEPIYGYLLCAAHLAIHSNFNGEAYNFGPSSENIATVSSMVKAFEKYFASNKKYGFAVKRESRFTESHLLKIASDKAFSDLGWRSRLGFEEALKLTAEWYRAYQKKSEDMRNYTIKQITKYMDAG